mgnify:FL=1
MKFIAIAAIAIVAAQDEMAAEEVAACAEGECNVTDAETGETACTAVVEGQTVCDPEATEEEGSTTLFASVAAVAVAATLMY